MPEIEITIDTESGTCESRIRGVRGPAACEKTARQIRDIIGEPSIDRKTAEYHQTVMTVVLRKSDSGGVEAKRKR